MLSGLSIRCAGTTGSKWHLTLLPCPLWWRRLTWWHLAEKWPHSVHTSFSCTQNHPCAIKRSGQQSDNPHHTYIMQHENSPVYLPFLYFVFCFNTAGINSFRPRKERNADVGLDSGIAKQPCPGESIIHLHCGEITLQRDSMHDDDPSFPVYIWWGGLFSVLPDSWLELNWTPSITQPISTKGRQVSVRPDFSFT